MGIGSHLRRPHSHWQAAGWQAAGWQGAWLAGGTTLESGVDPVVPRSIGRCEPTDSSRACLSASRTRRYCSSFLICSNSEFEACLSASRARRYCSSFLICSNWEIGTGTTSPDSVAADCARAVGIHNAWAKSEPAAATIAHKAIRLERKEMAHLRAAKNADDRTALSNRRRSDPAEVGTRRF